jgi:FAD/FMN-containing dehydrogenase
VTAFELMQREGLDLVVKHIPGAVDPFPGHAGWTVLIEVSNPRAFDATEALEQALAASMEEATVTDAVFAKTLRDREALWRLRETMPEAQRQEGASIANDISVPLTRIPEFLSSAPAAIRAALPAARPFAFGHVGDGNLHFAILAPGHDAELNAARSALEQIVQDETHRLGGSISAEHGLGLAKNDVIARYKTAAELDIMRALKRALDPRNILNPGKLLPSDPSYEDGAAFVSRGKAFD